jgi:hypothetical protein
MLAKLAARRNALYAGVSLVLFQQITGQPSVLYYATSIFQAAGFASEADATKVRCCLTACLHCPLTTPPVFSSLLVRR